MVPLCLLQDLKKVNSYLKSCFLIFPNYNLGHGLMELAYNEYINEYYAKIGTSTIKVLHQSTREQFVRRKHLNIDFLRVMSASVSRSVSQDEISV